MLVKALPHASDRHGETVCCAGLTERGEWRRQFPIRFRHLKDKKFGRWQWIEYDWRVPSDDKRPESRRVQEDSIIPGQVLAKGKRAAFIDPYVVPSVSVAVERGQTLALIRPQKVQFSWEKKSLDVIEAERKTYIRAASQTSFFDDELKGLEPCPYSFRFRYLSEDGKPHNHTCDDWETTAAYYKLSNKYGPTAALEHLDKMYNEEYPKNGMALALGTHSQRPEQWLLVGVIRLDIPDQMGFQV